MKQDREEALFDLTLGKPPRGLWFSPPRSLWSRTKPLDAVHVNVATGQEMLGVPLGAGLFQSEFNRDGTILAVGTHRIEGTSEAYNVHPVRVPTLAEIADEEVKSK